MTETIVKTNIIRKSQQEEGAVLMNNPAYREQLKKLLDAAHKGNVDVVHSHDGTIIFIETKPVMTSYVWDPKKREFVRKKQQAIAKSDNCST